MEAETAKQRRLVGAIGATYHLTKNADYTDLPCFIEGNVP
jgi:hypothetical protein